jgi:hypothetical protein
MKPLNLLDLSAGLLLVIYGALFMAGSLKNWRWMIREDRPPDWRAGRDYFRLSVFLIGCSLVLVGFYLLLGKGGLF